MLPFETLYRDALSLLVQDVHGVAGAIVQLGPLGGSHDAGPLLLPWIVCLPARLVAAAGRVRRSAAATSSASLLGTCQLAGHRPGRRCRRR